MKYELKEQIYNFLCNVNDNSKECAELIKEMERELNYADVDCHSICADDLSSRGDKAKKALGKEDDEPFAIQDCIKVASAMTEFLADEFGEDLDYVLTWVKM